MNPSSSPSSSKMNSSPDLSSLLDPVKSRPKNIDLDQISNAITIDDNATFQKSSFKLKRTRSMGVLDDFIRPSTSCVEDTYPHLSVATMPVSTRTSSENLDGLICGQFVDNLSNVVAGEPIIEESAVVEDEETSQETIDNSNRNLIENIAENAIDNVIVNISPALFSPQQHTDAVVPMHDDNDIQYEPSRHVDYLSHDWRESDISSSWRYIVFRKKRKDVENSARLENASWRTWAQAKYNLKTISPEKVNWLKDCDITWLYGPLCREQNSSATSLNDIYRYNNHDGIVPGKKPILKKKTVSEMILESAPMFPQPEHDHVHGHNHNYINNDSNSYNSQQNDSISSPIASPPSLPESSAVPFNKNSIFNTTPETYHVYDSPQNDPVVNLPLHIENQVPLSDTTSVPASPLYPNNNHFHISNASSVVGSPLILANSGSVPTTNPLVAPSVISLNSVSSGSSISRQSNSPVISSLPDNLTNQMVLSSQGAENIVSTPLSGLAPALAAVKKVDRRIHFNDRVEQCISINIINSDDEGDGYSSDSSDSDDYRYSRYDNHHDNNRYGSSSSGQTESDSASESESDEDSEDEDGPGLFLAVRSPSSTSLYKPEYFPVMDDTNIPDSSDNNNISSNNSQPEATSTPLSNTQRQIQTIALLPATTLKACVDDIIEQRNVEYEANSVAYAMSHNTSTPRRYFDYNVYDYNSVYSEDNANKDGTQIYTNVMDQGNEPVVSSAETPPSTSSSPSPSSSSVLVSPAIFSEASLLAPATVNDILKVENTNSISTVNQGGNNDDIVIMPVELLNVMSLQSKNINNSTIPSSKTRFPENYNSINDDLNDYEAGHSLSHNTTINPSTTKKNTMILFSDSEGEDDQFIEDIESPDTVSGPQYHWNSAPFSLPSTTRDFPLLKTAEANANENSNANTSVSAVITPPPLLRSSSLASSRNSLPLNSPTAGSTISTSFISPSSSSGTKLPINSPSVAAGSNNSGNTPMNEPATAAASLSSSFTVVSTPTTPSAAVKKSHPLSYPMSSGTITGTSVCLPESVSPTLCQTPSLSESDFIASIQSSNNPPASSSGSLSASNSGVDCNLKQKLDNVTGSMVPASLTAPGTKTDTKDTNATNLNSSSSSLSVSSAAINTKEVSRNALEHQSHLNQHNNHIVDDSSDGTLSANSNSNVLNRINSAARDMASSIWKTSWKRS
ncbi:hypothetical protein NADFUDRAFT_82245 [Nadsonia fulvescens var. elongata DSM 6958]|uniref:Nitrogen regulatory protein areA GATA-like domain-containing protein n=1 Tax=Nadsonia fulvescens var. elongata DSM 6958 TaxID=857566 RepID=A0A1E3PLV5_9ASCO|nr:hypothetical protein NADFUDRAFT_82245 [Nadsonia fulvescens var. elongata DSM 6958]